MAKDLPPAGPEIRTQAIQALEQLILDVKQGRVNLLKEAGLNPSYLSRKTWLEESEARLDRLKQIHMDLRGVGQ